MNMQVGNIDGMAQCPTCWQWYYVGIGHNCRQYIAPQHTFTHTPCVSLEDIRKIVREELDRPKHKKRRTVGKTDE
jgi:hypothetical protein